MSLLDSLLQELILILVANRGRNTRVQQQRRRLWQLVTMIRSVADAAECRRVRNGSLAEWLHLLREEALLGQAVLNATNDPAGTASAVVGSTKRLLIKALFMCSPEVDRLSQAIQELESLAGDLDRFLKVLELSTSADMDIDSGGAVSSNQLAVAATDREEIPILGAKRKREASCDGDEESNDGSTTAEAAPSRLQRVKRRILSWMRTNQWFACFPAGPACRPAVAPRVRRARRVMAEAMARVRSRRAHPRRAPRPAGRRTASLQSLERQLARVTIGDSCNFPHAFS